MGKKALQSTPRRLVSLGHVRDIAGLKIEAAPRRPAVFPHASTKALGFREAVQFYNTRACCRFQKFAPGRSKRLFVAASFYYEIFRSR
jgi:hypothetical protein